MKRKHSIWPPLRGGRGFGCTFAFAVKTGATLQRNARLWPRDFSLFDEFSDGPRRNARKKMNFSSEGEKSVAEKGRLAREWRLKTHFAANSWLTVKNPFLHTELRFVLWAVVPGGLHEGHQIIGF